jgi:putative redox protein
MCVDLVHILQKGRHELSGVRARLTAERAADDPRRLVAAALHFIVQGAVPSDAVERALELSRAKYCSVWHSLRQDIRLRMMFDVQLERGPSPAA